MTDQLSPQVETWSAQGLGLFRNRQWVTSTTTPEVATFLAEKLNDRAALQAQLDELLKFKQGHEYILGHEIDKGIEAFRQRAVAAVQALFHNSEVESARWNQAITEAVAKLQQLSTTSEDGE